MGTALRWVLGVAGFIVVLSLLLAAAGQAGMLTGTAPADLGVREGKLKAPATTPNSVSSQADLWPGHPQRDFARIAPLALAGDGTATMAKIRRIVETTPGAKIVQADAGYLRAEYTSQVLKFVDDVEFWFDPAAGVVQVRSASRLGEGDLGANRNRIENLRARLATP